MRAPGGYGSAPLPGRVREGQGQQLHFLSAPELGSGFQGRVWWCGARPWGLGGSAPGPVASGAQNQSQPGSLPLHGLSPGSHLQVAFPIDLGLWVGMPLPTARLKARSEEGKAGQCRGPRDGCQASRGQAWRGSLVWWTCELARAPLPGPPAALAQRPSLGGAGHSPPTSWLMGPQSRRRKNASAVAAGT